MAKRAHKTVAERVAMSEQALREAFRSLPTHTKYFELIDFYFDNVKIDEDTYYLVKDRIEALWERVRKEADFLEHVLDFEPLLRELGLRDHFKHSFNVYLLGYYIINKLYVLGDKLEFFHTSQEKSNLIWLLASTFHDVAYAVEKTDKWLNEFFEKFLGINLQFSFKVTEVLTPAYTDFMRMLSAHHKDPKTFVFNFAFDNMDWYYYNELSRELGNKNHGVLGALMLCHRMAIKEGFLCERPADVNGVIEGRDQWDFLNHLTASHAISLHCAEAIPIRFNQHPFAYMLVLCDEIQDWGRGDTQDNDFVALEWVEVKVEENLPKIEFKIDCESKRMELLFSTLRKRLMSDEYAPKIIINGETVF